MNKRLKIVGEELSEPEGWVTLGYLIGGQRQRGDMYAINPCDLELIMIWCVGSKERG